MQCFAFIVKLFSSILQNLGVSLLISDDNKYVAQMRNESILISHRIDSTQ